MLELTPHHPLDLRQVSRLVFDTIGSYQELNGTQAEAASKYVRLLAQSLSDAQLHRTGLQGSYLDLYFPTPNGEKNKAVAVKVIDTSGWMLRHAAEQRLKTLASEAELKAIFADKSYVHFSHLPEETSFEQLGDQEKMLLYFALEHRRFEQYYAPYILPAVFISFITSQGSTGTEQFSNDDERGEYFIESLSKLQRLTPDNREIYLHRNQLLFAMVQNFENLGPSIFKMDPTTLTEDQRRQIADLATKIETVYQKTGYFPDESMANRSTNLCFTGTGQLVLIDTNHLDHADHVMGASISYVKLLRKLAQGEKPEYR